MARFIVVHRLPATGTQDEVIEAGKTTINALPTDTEWLRSWVVHENACLFCEWEAQEKESIQAALKGMELFPVEVIYPVIAIDPAWFKGSTL
jgi:hypothetical protein